jgi:hypothetical protein
MIAATKITCYACEEPAGRTAVVLENLYDGETLVMHRRCILRIIDRIAQDEGDEDLAAQLHHQLAVQGIFKDGDTVVRQRKAAVARHDAQKKLWFDPTIFPEQEPTVPQRNSNAPGFDPDAKIRRQS